MIIIILNKGVGVGDKRERETGKLRTERMENCATNFVMHFELIITDNVNIKKNGGQQNFITFSFIVREMRNYFIFILRTGKIS